MIFNELPVAFPWYEKLEQQNRYNENVEPICDYKLISPADAFLPFQFAKTQIGGVLPNMWEVYDVNTQTRVADISSQIAILDRRALDGREYFTYHGAKITGLGLPTGYYYSRMAWPDGTFQFSEMFHVPEKWFNIADDDNIEYLKFVWYNQNDLRPIFYNDLGTDGLPKFKNVLYLDSFITASEPEIVEDGTRDGNDELIPTFQKAIINYRITAAVPDFVKRALSLLNMHDYRLLTTKRSVRTGSMDTVKVSSALEASGALSIVDIIFSEAILLKKGCGENMV